MLAANEDVVVLDFCNSADDDAFNAGGVRVQRGFCHFSNLVECWLSSERAPSEARLICELSICPDGAAGIF